METESASSALEQQQHQQQPDPVEELRAEQAAAIVRTFLVKWASWVIFLKKHESAFSQLSGSFLTSQVLGFVWEIGPTGAP